MSRIRVVWNSTRSSAALMAPRDYGEEDWDPVARGLALRGVLPLDMDPVATCEHYEIFLFYDPQVFTTKEDGDLLIDTWSERIRVRHSCFEGARVE